MNIKIAYLCLEKKIRFFYESFLRLPITFLIQEPVTLLSWHFLIGKGRNSGRYY